MKENTTTTWAIGWATIRTWNWWTAQLSLSVFLCLLLPKALEAQISLDTAFGLPTLSIPIDIPGVSQIETDQEGNVYLLASARHRMYKLYRSSRYDSVQSIGGKGIGPEGFNFPSKLVVPNRQSTYLLDFMNRRLVQMNTNLKIIEEINFLTISEQNHNSELENLFPFSFAIGPSGELYLLNQEDNKVYKFTTNGRLELSFAGLDYGAGSVNEPSDVQTNQANNVFIVDFEDQSLSVFDLYGVFQYRMAVPVPFTWEQAHVFAQSIIYFNQHEFYFYNTFSKKAGLHLSCEEKVIDISLNAEFLFVLYENKVNLHPIGRPD